MAKRPRSKTDEKHILGVERIDAEPEDIARALFAPIDRRAQEAAKARRKRTQNK